MSQVRPAEVARRRRGEGMQLYASRQAEARARRPTDVALAIVSAIALILAAAFTEVAEDFETELIELLASLPGLLDPLWRLAFWAAPSFGVLLLAIAVVRGRRELARDLLLSLVAALLMTAVVSWLVMDDDRGVFELLVDANGPPVFPPGAVVLAAAVISTASPHLSRPFRHLGRWLLTFQFIASLMLLAASVSGAAGALATGTLAAAIVHLVFGSPGGRPTESRIRLALAELGVMVDDLAPAAMQPAGIVLFEGRDAQGPLLVKVYGRDAWDAQMLATLWRLAWYRGSERTAGLSRVDLVEHEGFITLLAERAGVHVPHLVTAGSAGRGDALVVVRPEGAALAARFEAGPESGSPVDVDISSLWPELRRLHDGGIVHGRIDLDRVIVRRAGAVGFGDMSSATVAEQPYGKAKDQAQLIGLSLLVDGEEAATESARAALGDERLTAVLPFVQEAAMPPLLRDALDAAEIDLDEVRTRLGEQLGAGDLELIKLRRVTVGSILNMALLGLAAYALIALLGGLDLDTFAEALGDANWWWLGAALVLAQIPRIPAAVSTMGSISRPLPLGPLTTLQFAICYVNLAIPSTAARVAVNVRFFQRFGVPPVAAMSAGVIDSVSGFVVQIVLFLSLFFLSDADLDVSTDTGDLSGLATLALITIGVVVVGIVIVLVVPALRRRLLAAISEARQSMLVLKSPTKLLQLFGGNLLSQVLFGVALAACVEAFGEQVPLSQLVLINTVVSLFAGLLPVPGGIGVSEAGLTLGLTTAGLSSESAFAIALAYRFASFYLPPVWGWFCYRWLVRQRYL